MFLRFKLHLIQNMFLYLVISLFIANNYCIVRSDEEVYYWDPDIYPNLTSVKHAKFCTGSKRNPPSAVCDPDEVLRKEEGIVRKLLYLWLNPCKSIQKFINYNLI